MVYSAIGVAWIPLAVVIGILVEFSAPMAWSAPALNSCTHFRCGARCVRSFGIMKVSSTSHPVGEQLTRIVGGAAGAIDEFGVRHGGA